ncbi:sugar phosphate isomerase/epimerase [Paenibacillus sp. SORGH_AS306]|uniref:sugar phosphate isomerase/epimerase family protein n=1 Tax=Paenibacillus sp. SORGH_AS_0306 TaxID=3041754 RepID=UPI00278A8954|nr:sugar phosphate isomerase/epimerase [Paenibacillus sp. SORGH_AS_0306]MDQ1236240.1 sugar phosphate isomerase/epimerase [Paenibacillus sp. SORGH_AS_0306]
MKLSVFTVCTPDLTPEQLITAATQAGIDGIEWRFAAIPQDAQAEAPSFWRHNRCSIDPEHTEPSVSIIKQSVQQHQLESIALVPYLKCGDLDSTHHAFATASQLGASMMRVGVPMYDRSRHYRDLDAEATRYLSSVQELSQQYGIQALIETHHQTIAASASAALRLVEHLDPQYVGVLYDPGNMVHEGYENYRMGLQLLGPYLAHVHVKNAAWIQQDQQWQCQWAPILEGIVPWQQIISDLQSVGYDGYLGVEDFSAGKWIRLKCYRILPDHFVNLPDSLSRRVNDERYIFYYTCRYYWCREYGECSCSYIIIRDDYRGRTGRCL